jgi:hypothetical protein
MDYLDYKLAKAGVLVLMAFCWGIWRGISGQPLSRGQSDTQSSTSPKDRSGG